jgi:hypothetical protein
MMNENEHLLTVLGEEGGEVAKECAKALRFGIADKLTLDPEGPRGTEGPTNAEKIVAELNDLLGVARMLVSRGVIPAGWESEARQQRKIRRVIQYMNYAVRVDALRDFTVRDAIEVEALPIAPGALTTRTGDKITHVGMDVLGIHAGEDDCACIADTNGTHWATGDKDGRKVRVRVQN